MKKLIAIAVVFVLVAGVAFAADVSGEVIGQITPFKGSSEEDSKVQAYGLLYRSRIGAQGQNDDGTFGGWIRFEAGNNWGNGGTVWAESVVSYGLAWWKPIEQLKFQIGVNPDGEFAADGVARWGFYQVAGDARVVDEGWFFSNSFYAGYGTPGAILTVTPIEGLAINLAFPFLATGWGENAEDFYKKTAAQVAYNISGIGNLALTFAGDLGNKTASNMRDSDGNPNGDLGTTFGANGSKLYVYFGLTAVENLSVDVGLGYTMAVTDETSDDVYTAPVAAGLAVKFDSGAFGVKARVQGQFGATYKYKATDTTAKLPTVIDFDVLPYYAISDTVTGLLSAGLKITSPDEGDAVTGWHIEPYITVKAGWWAPNFYAGLRIASDGVKDADDKTTTTWAVPIGIVFSF